MSPVRFAVAASGALACLMLGLVAGVRVGTNQTAHVMSVRTVTRTAHGNLQGADAAARTVTRTRTVARTVHDPVTVTETVTVQAPGPKPKHKPKPPKPKPPHYRDGGGHGDGGGDGGGEGD